MKRYLGHRIPEITFFARSASFPPGYIFWWLRLPIPSRESNPHGFLHLSFESRNGVYIPVFICAINKVIPGGDDAKVSHEGMDNIFKTGEVCAPASPGNRTEDPTLAFGSTEEHTLGMVCLAAVDEDFECAGDGVCVDRRGNDKDATGADRVDDPRHIIVKRAGSGIITLVASDAGMNIKIVRIDHCGCPSRMPGCIHHPFGEYPAVSIGTGASCDDDKVCIGSGDAACRGFSWVRKNPALLSVSSRSHAANRSYATASAFRGTRGAYS